MTEIQLNLYDTKEEWLIRANVRQTYSQTSNNMTFLFSPLRLSWCRPHSDNCLRLAPQEDKISHPQLLFQS